MTLKSTLLLGVTLLCAPLFCRAGNYAKSKGVLYVWTMPDNFADLYAMPPEVTTAIENYIMRGFLVRGDGPATVALFAYDNGTFIVQDFSAAAADERISTLGNATQLKNLVTRETSDGNPPLPQHWNWGNQNIEDRVSFNVKLLRHSYADLVLKSKADIQPKSAP